MADDKDTEQETETKGGTTEEEETPTEKPAGPPSISDVYSKISQNAPQIRDKIAEATDLTPKQVEEHIPGAMSMVRGAAVATQGGQDATQLHPEALRAADPAATHAELAKEDPNAMSNQKKIFLALGSILPTVAGFAVGGWRGGQAGAEATGKTAQTLSSEMLRQQQISFERGKFATEMGLKAKHEDSYAKGEAAKSEQARIAGQMLPVHQQEAAIKAAMLNRDLRKDQVGETKDIQKEFNDNPETKASQETIAKVYKAKETLLSNSKVAFSAFPAIIARVIADESGKIPVQDEDRFKAPGGVFDKLKQKAQQIATGQIDDDLRKETMELLDTVNGVARDRLIRTAQVHAYQGSQRLKTSPAVVNSLLGTDKMLQIPESVTKAETAFRTRMAKKAPSSAPSGNMIERVLGAGQSSAQAQGPADPVIDQYAKSHGLDYGMATNILRKRGYNAPGQ